MHQMHYLIQGMAANNYDLSYMAESINRIKKSLHKPLFLSGFLSLARQKISKTIGYFLNLRGLIV